MQTHSNEPTTVWRTMGGDNSRRGISASSFTPKGKPSLRLEAKGSVLTAPIFDRKGTIFIADMAGWVQSFSPDGKPLWQRDLGGGIRSTPVLDEEENRLYAGTLTYGIFALDAKTGEVIWKKPLTEKNDPRILSDLLYLPKAKLVIASSWGEEYVALDAISGEKRFSLPAGFSPQAAASATSEETIYILRAKAPRPPDRPSCAVRLLQVDAQTGKETSLLEQKQSPDKAGSRTMAVMAAPVIDEPRNRIFIITNLDHEAVLHCLALASGEEQWQARFTRNVYATPAVSRRGDVVVADLNGEAHCFDEKGTRRYRYPTGAYYLLSSPVCDREGRVIVGDSEGKIHVISPEGVGEPFFEAERCIQGRPAFDPEGRLFAPSGDGNVYVF